MKPFGLVFVSILTLSTTTSFARTWYVSSSGSDSNNGQSLQTAFLTPQHAADLTTPGDTVKFIGTFGGGTNGQAPLIIHNSGAPGLPITYESYSNTANNRAIFSGTHSAGVIEGYYPLSYVTINNLEIAGWLGSLTWAGASANAGASGSSWQSETYSGAATSFSGSGNGQTLHHISFTNNYVHDFPGGGLGCAFCDYMTVTQNSIHNTGFYSPWAMSGISLYELHNIDSGTETKNIVSRNTLSNNINYIPDRAAIVFTTTSAGTNNAGTTYLTITNATAANYTEAVIDVSQGCIPPGTTVQYFGVGYVGLSQPVSCAIPNGSILQFGYITDGEGIIIDNNDNSQSDNIPYVGRTLIVNNVGFNNGSSCIEVAPGTNNVDVIFNTCFWNQTSFQNMSSANGELNDRGANGINVYNNIFDALTTTPSGWDQSAGTTVFSNNLFYGGNAAHPIPGVNNVLSDPKFANASIGSAMNLQLQAGSPAIDAGSSAVTRNTDYLGNCGLVGRAFDIGAFEAPPSIEAGN